MAFGKNTSQTGVSGDNVASRAVDGDTDPVLANEKCAHPKRSDENRAKWKVDLGDTHDVTNVILFTRDLLNG